VVIEGILQAVEPPGKLFDLLNPVFHRTGSHFVVHTPDAASHSFDWHSGIRAGMTDDNAGM
jgi:hypothetical protein